MWFIHIYWVLTRLCKILSKTIELHTCFTQHMCTVKYYQLPYFHSDHIDAAVSNGQRHFAHTSHTVSSVPFTAPFHLWCSLSSVPVTYEQVIVHLTKRHDTTYKHSPLVITLLPHRYFCEAEWHCVTALREKAAMSRIFFIKSMTAVLNIWWDVWQPFVKTDLWGIQLNTCQPVRLQSGKAIGQWRLLLSLISSLKNTRLMTTCKAMSSSITLSIYIMISFRYILWS